MLPPCCVRNWSTVRRRTLPIAAPGCSAKELSPPAKRRRLHRPSDVSVAVPMNVSRHCSHDPRRTTPLPPDASTVEINLTPYPGWRTGQHRTPRPPTGSIRDARDRLAPLPQAPRHRRQRRRPRTRPLRHHATITAPNDQSGRLTHTSPSARDRHDCVLSVASTFSTSRVERAVHSQRSHSVRSV